ncbi:MAG: exonuclease SbcCD subunit D [Acidimicrobiales bacterium]
MRLLHTADWHVGRTIRGRSRHEEHEAVLAELVELAERDGVDAVLVCGDLFDSAAPTAEAERLVYRALLALAGERRHVVVIAGNHDNPRRLDAVRPLLGLGRVHVAPFVARPDEGGVLSLQVAGEPLTVALAPFLSQRYVVHADALMSADADELVGDYQHRLGRVFAALREGFDPSAVNVVAAHLTVVGGALGGGERPAHTVFAYAVPAALLPADAHYAALGHLHRCQPAGAGCPAWYSGSPLQLDFGDEANEPAALVIDATPGTPAVVETRLLRAGRRLRTLAGDAAQLAELAGVVGDDSHLRLLVEGEARAGLVEELRELFPQAVEVRLGQPGAAPGAAAGVSRLGRSPAELFAEYLAERQAQDPRVEALFAELADTAALAARDDAAALAAPDDAAGGVRAGHDAA